METKTAHVVAALPTAGEPVCLSCPREPQSPGSEACQACGSALPQARDPFALPHLPNWYWEEEAPDDFALAVDSLATKLEAHGLDAAEARTRAAASLLPYWNGYKAREDSLAKEQGERRRCLGRRIALAFAVLMAALAATSVVSPDGAALLATTLGAATSACGLFVGVVFARSGRWARKMWSAWGETGGWGLALGLCAAGAGLLLLGALMS